MKNPNSIFTLLLMFLCMGSIFAQEDSTEAREINNSSLQMKNQEEGSHSEANKNDYLGEAIYIVEADGKQFQTTDKDEFMPYVTNEQIESIHVYNDSKAVEKYGNEGKNGVVQVILKEGVLNSLPEPVQAKFKH